MIGDFRDMWYPICGGPSLLVNAHKYVKTKEAAATLSIKAGLDLECGDDVYYEPLLNAYKQYMVSDADIDSTPLYHVLKAPNTVQGLTMVKTILILRYLRL